MRTDRDEDDFTPAGDYDPGWKLAAERASATTAHTPSSPKTAAPAEDKQP